jgi:para-aminobenzoate synthetase/4-amino-4-deoxychorismate lyase
MHPLSTQEITALALWLESQEEFVFLDNARPGGEEHRSLLFLKPRSWLFCQGQGQVEEFLAEAAALQRQGYVLAGWFGYEFGYLLEPSLHRLDTGGAPPYAVLGVFAEPMVLDHRQDTAPLLAALVGTSEPAQLEPVRVEDLLLSMDREEYLRAVSRIKEYIVGGDTYQVNYTLKLRFACRGSASSLYTGLRRNQAVAYGAWIRQGGRDIMSFSPELFFRADSRRVTVRPMKGTMSRGRSLAEDARRCGDLRDDPKNRSENVMIVDLLRNDLGRLLHDAGGGRVVPRSLFDVEALATVLQMTSTIDGFPDRPYPPDLGEMLRALFPCGSVTGAPKIRTMEIIRELEKEPRGVYCGAIGYCGLQETVFNVPIRTVVLRGGQGEMGIGSGIVFDSDPAAEWTECLLKAQFVTGAGRDFQLIETLLWRPAAGYWLLAEHLQRLEDSAAYFFFPCSREKTVATLNEAVGSWGGPMRVRLLLDRDGGMTLSAIPCDVSPVLDPDQAPVQDPRPEVVFSEFLTDRADIYLFHKTTERGLYQAERDRALARGFYEVLFANQEGEATEGSITTLFVRQGEQLLTPPVDCGLLPGTFRGFLLAQGRAVERVLSREEVCAAAEVFVGNSVRGLVRVRVSPWRKEAK